MRLIHSDGGALIAATAILILAAPSPAAAQATLTVNTTDDVNDSVCDATHCSLREALHAANNAGAATILFDIFGAPPHTILPATALPTIRASIVIDGASEPDFPGTPVVEIDGTDAGSAHGLHLFSGSSTIRSLAINRFELNGIDIAPSSGGNVIEGNYIGTDITGAVARPNGHGILVFGSSGNTIGGTSPDARNVISGNDLHGIEITQAAATQNVVLGNYIGVDADGSSVLGNGWVGVQITAAPDNTIGGLDPGARNVISGNVQDGVRIVERAAIGNVVVGNLVGTDATGSADRGNLERGVSMIRASGNIVGGLTESARNVISGNDLSGIYITLAGLSESGPASENVVQGNYIGTDATGTVAVGNRQGVQIFGEFDTEEVSRNTIGGDAEGAGNLISGNERRGVLIHGIGSNENVVAGNLIGTDFTGLAPLGNGEHGVSVSSGSDNRIGGISQLGCQGPCNVVAFNGAPGLGWDGVRILSGTGNSVLGNSIHSNEALGIDIGEDGPTDNDLGDEDGGANDNLNFPILYRGGATIQGLYNGPASSELRLEFFSNDECEASGRGQGARFLGATDVTTDASGNADFTFDLADTLWVTATATDTQGNTSEQSECASMIEIAVDAERDTATVAIGDAAEYTVMVSSTGGAFSGELALACEDLPASSACSFTPATVVPGADTAAVALEVTTSSSGTPVGDAAFSVVAASSVFSASAPLTVTVTDFEVALSDDAITIARGASADVSVSVSSLGGAFPADVTLSCTGLQEGAACAFSPSVVSPDDGGATATLTITTGVEGQHGPVRRPVEPPPLPMALALTMAFAAILGMARRSRPRLAMAAVTTAVLVLGACREGPTEIAPVTFTVTVAGTSGDLSHSETVSVTVD